MLKNKLFIKFTILLLCLASGCIPAKVASSDNSALESEKKDAQEKLKIAQDDLAKAQADKLKAEGDLTALRNFNPTAQKLLEAEAKLKAATEAKDKAEQAQKTAENNLEQAEGQLTALQSSASPELAEAQNKLALAEQAQKTAEAKLKAATEAKDQANLKLQQVGNKLAQAKLAEKEAKQAQTDAETKLTLAQQAQKTAENNLAQAEAAKNLAEGKLNTLKSSATPTAQQLAEAKTKLAQAEQAQKAAETKLTLAQQAQKTAENNLAQAKLAEKAAVEAKTDAENKLAQAKLAEKAAVEAKTDAEQEKLAALEAKDKAENKLKNNPLAAGSAEKIENFFITLSPNLATNIINEIVAQKPSADNAIALEAMLKNDKITPAQKISALEKLTKQKNLTSEEQKSQSNMTTQLLAKDEVKNALKGYENGSASNMLTAAVDNPSEASKLVLEALLDNNENLTPSNIATAFKKLDEKNNKEAKAMMQVIVDKIENLKMTDLNYIDSALKTFVTLKNNTELIKNMLTNMLNKDDIKTALKDITNISIMYREGYHANALLTAAVDNPSEASKLVLEALLDNNENLTPSNIATAFKKLDEKNNKEAKAMMQVIVDKIENLKMTDLNYIDSALKTFVTLKNNTELIKNMLTNMLNKDDIKTALKDITNISIMYREGYHANALLTAAVDNPSEASKLVLEALLDNNENLTPSNIATAFKKLDEKNNEEAKVMMQVMVNKIENLKMSELTKDNRNSAFGMIMSIKNNNDLKMNMLGKIGRNLGIQQIQ